MSSKPPDEDAGPPEAPRPAPAPRKGPARKAVPKATRFIPEDAGEALAAGPAGTPLQPSPLQGRGREGPAGSWLHSLSPYYSALLGTALLIGALLLQGGAPGRSSYPEEPGFPEWAWWFAAPEDNGFLRWPDRDRPIFTGLARSPGSERLWAVEGGGELWLSTDDGETWARQSLLTRYRVMDVDFIAGGMGHVLFQDGWMLRTTDDGRSWRLFRTPLSQARSGGGDYGLREPEPGFSLITSARAEAPPPEQKVSKQAASPPAPRTNDETPRQQSVDPDQHPAQQSIIEPDFGPSNVPNRAAQEPLPGSVSPDGAKGIGTVERPRALAFADAQRGVLLSTARLWVTADGGQSWVERLRLSDDSFVELSLEPQTWLALANNGLYQSAPGGERWEKVFGTSSYLLGMGRQPAPTRLLLGTQGFLSSFNGRYEVLLSSGTQANLSAAAFFDQAVGLVVGSNRTVLRSSDGGQSWGPVALATSEADAALIDVLSLDSRRAVIAGLSGAVLLTDDTGLTWRGVQYARYPPPFGWILGLSGFLLLLRNLGAPLWRKLEPWRRALRRRWSPETEPPSGAWAPAEVQPVVISDAALDRAEQDRLGMATLARGLAFFLRNENTRPPVTLAVTGAWGSGKSSLMRMLKTELERAWYFPIWLNAWHHHEEEHLYGALLETLRQHGLPSFWRVSGCWIRLKLAGIRTRRHWPVLLLLATLCVLGLRFAPDGPCVTPDRGEAFVLDDTFQACLKESQLSGEGLAVLQGLAYRTYASPVALALSLGDKEAPILSPTDKAILLRALGLGRKELGAAASAPDDALAALSELPLFQSEFFKTALQKWFAGSTAVTSLLALVAALLRGMSAFGLRPGSLLRGAAEEASADPGLRFRVHQALRDICQAMGRRGPVIFIDDLDRCPPEQMKRVLEFVNFLADNERRCFVVLGAALDRVLPALASQFEAQVQEAQCRYPDRGQASAWVDWQRSRPVGGGEPTDSPQNNDEVWAEWLRLRRREYAESYLEKMINLEVGVPQAPPQAMPGLVLAAAEEPPRKGVRFWFDRWLLPALFTLVVGAVAATQIAFTPGAAVGGTIETGAAPAVMTVAPAEPAASGAAAGDAGKENAQAVSAPAEAIPAPSVPGVLTGQDKPWLVVLGGLLVAALGAAASSALGSRVLFAHAEISEGERFPQALAIWQLPLTTRNQTPRHFKLLVNQLRLMAMRGLAELEDEARHALSRGLPARAPEAAGQALAVRFVMLSALEEAGIDLPAFFRWDGNRAAHWLDPNAEPPPADCFLKRSQPAPERLEALALALGEHAQLQVAAWPSTEDMARYRRLKGDVILR